MARIRRSKKKKKNDNPIGCRTTLHLKGERHTPTARQHSSDSGRELRRTKQGWRHGRSPNEPPLISHRTPSVPRTAASTSHQQAAEVILQTRRRRADYHDQCHASDDAHHRHRCHRSQTALIARRTRPSSTTTIPHLSLVPLAGKELLERCPKRRDT
jgi:hypothetical protein